MAKTKAPSAKLMDGKKETSLPIEEIKQPETYSPPAIIPLTPEEEAKNEVAKFDIKRAWIAEKKEAYSGLKIAGKDDKAGYSIAEKAWQEVRNKRLAVEKKHKELKAKYLVVGRAIDQEKNELVELIEEIEAPLKSMLVEIDNAILEEKNKAEREAQEKLQSRTVTLIEAGLKFTGSYYTIGETISIDAVTLKTMIDADFEKLLGSVKAENDKIQAEIQRKADEEKAELQRIEQQRIDQEAKELELKKQQEDLKRQHDEIAQQKKEMREQLIKNRCATLESMGMVHNFQTDLWVFRTADVSQGVSVVHEKIGDMSAEDFSSTVAEVAPKIADIKAAQATIDKERADAWEKSEKERLDRELKEIQKHAKFESRAAILKHEYNFTQTSNNFERKFNDGGSVIVPFPKVIDSSDDEWLEALETIQSQVAHGENQERIFKLKEDEKKENDRIAALSDVEKVKEYISDLQSISTNIEIKNEKIRAAWENYIKKSLAITGELLDIITE